VGAAVSAVAVATFAWLGLYSRYLADDYGVAVGVRTQGFFGAQVESYRAWSGRCASTFFSALLALGGPAITPYVTVVLLLLWCVAAERALASLIPGLRAEARWLFALIFVWAACDGAFDLFQSLLWQTGAVTYVLPLVFLLATVAAIAKGRPLAIPAVLAFLTSASSEILAASLTVAMAICVVGTFARGGGLKPRPAFVAGLIGAALGLAVVAAAPGNAVRRAHFPAAPPLLTELAMTVKQSGQYAASFVERAGAQAALVFFAAILVASFVPPENRRKAVLAAWLSAAAAVAVANFIVIDTGYGYPPGRGLVTTDVFVFGAIAMSGFAASRVLTDVRRQAMVAIVVALLILAGPVRTIFLNAALVPAARSFAERWDATDARLRSSPGASVTVDVPVKVGGIIWVTPYPAHPMNRAMAEYYGLRSLATFQK
jgi:hypothetical protein